VNSEETVSHKLFRHSVDCFVFVVGLSLALPFFVLLAVPLIDSL
jgi:hypothetical protein